MRRPIIATFLRAGVPHSCRRYAKLDNAIPRATQLLMWHGQPRDVVEFSHVDTGMQIGTIKISVGGVPDHEVCMGRCCQTWLTHLDWRLP